MERTPNPTYVQGLSARSRLTEARAALWGLLMALPPRRQAALVRLYNTLSQAQGELEKLLEDIPAAAPAGGDTSDAGGGDGG